MFAAAESAAARTVAAPAPPLPPRGHAAAGAAQDELLLDNGTFSLDDFLELAAFSPAARDGAAPAGLFLGTGCAPRPAQLLNTAETPRCAPRGARLTQARAHTPAGAPHAASMTRLFRSSACWSWSARCRRRARRCVAARRDQRDGRRGAARAAARKVSSR